MVRTLVVILAIVTVIVLLVPRPNALPQAGVDPQQAARGAGSQLGFVPDVPRGLPEGWVVQAAQVRRSQDGIVTWHLGYITPEGRYAGVEQAGRSTRAWEEILDGGGQVVGSQEIAGRTWEQRYREPLSLTTLIDRRPGHVTVVTSKGGGLGDARTLASALAPPAAP
jgi:hypothetical protein